MLMVNPGDLSGSSLPVLDPMLRERIERRALEISAAIDLKSGPYSAEIVPDMDPHWHAITHAPSASERAAKFLVDRNFGIYVPTFEQTWVTRGRKITRRLPLFPGHIFVFVWDVLRHWRRIKSCPGVVGILTVDQRPVIIPDKAIDRMQGIEFNGIQVERPKRRRRKKNRPIEDENDNDIMSISTKSYWSKIAELDDQDRIGVLHKALGLAS